MRTEMPDQDTLSAPEPAPNWEHQAVLYRWERGPYGWVVRTHHVETWNYVSIFVGRWAREEEKPLGAHRLSRAGRTYKLDASKLVDTGRVWSEDAEAWFGRTPQPPEGADLRSPWRVAEEQHLAEQRDRAWDDLVQTQEVRAATTAELRLRCAAWETACQDLDTADAASRALSKRLEAEAAAAAEAEGKPAEDAGLDWLDALDESEEAKRRTAAGEAERSAFDALDAALVDAEQARADVRQARLHLLATNRSGRAVGTDEVPPTPQRALGRGEARRAARAAAALAAAVDRLHDPDARAELITRALAERWEQMGSFSDLYRPHIAAMLEAGLREGLGSVLQTLVEDAERAAEAEPEAAGGPDEAEDTGSAPEETQG
jgi:hypothetical protein